MRILTVAMCLSLLLSGVAAAQDDLEPVGNLAQVMRAVFFPNSNILFDVQSTDPEAIGEKKEGEGASSTFSGIYKGWMVVEQAAIALAEGERLITVPGRLCENGKPVPLAQEDFQEWAKAMTAAAKEVLAAAGEKDREKVSDLTNSIAGACEDCHTKYRRYQDRCRQ